MSMWCGCIRVEILASASPCVAARLMRDDDGSEIVSKRAWAAGGKVGSPTKGFGTSLVTA